MALSPDPNTPPDERMALARIVGDEEASAVVEFIYLMPIYILLMTGLFMIGNLAHIRQSLVGAVRFQAWTANQNGPTGAQYTQQEYEDVFFQKDGAYSNPVGANTEVREAVWGGSPNGNPESNFPTPLALDPDGGTNEITRFATGGNPPAYAASRTTAEQIAGRVYSNSDETSPFWIVHARGTYTYDGVRMLVGQVAQTTQATVLIPRLHQRPEYPAQPNAGDTQTHPVTIWGDAGGNDFDPSVPANQPLSPLYESLFPDRGTTNPGVWDLDARINGTDTTERAYYVQTEGGAKANPP